MRIGKLPVLAMAAIPFILSTFHANSETLTEYAQRCRAEMGNVAALPAGSVNCRDGVRLGTNRIPMLDHDRPRKYVSFTHLYENDDQAGDKQIKTMLFCRDKDNSGDDVFEDVAIIQHNAETGATCFFQKLGTINGNNLPDPITGQFWLSPAGTAGYNCHECHDNGPFIRTPYIEQGAGNHPLISSSTSVGLFNQSTQDLKNGPYHFVGPDFQGWEVNSATHLTQNKCTGCHRIGTGPTGSAIRFGPYLAKSVSSNWHGSMDFGAEGKASINALKNCVEQFRQGRSLPSGCYVSEISGGPSGTLLNKAFIFSGTENSRYEHWLNGFEGVRDGYPVPLRQSWPTVTWSKVDAAFRWKSRGVVYLFSGQDYVKWDIANDVRIHGPNPIAGNWPGIWSKGIDAIISNGDYAYFFKGSRWRKYDLVNDRVVRDSKISDWGLPNDLDAGLNWGDSFQKAFFFKGTEYWRYDLPADRVDGGDYPLDTSTYWPGLFDSGISAAVHWSSN